MENIEYVELLGSVLNITFSSEETGFTVLDLESNNELICVVGQLFSVEVGEELKLTGFYVTHPTYGLQFKAQMYERSLPATASAIKRYLASGVVKGIGAAIAKRIVDRFGDDTLNIIEQDPSRLAEIQGITAKKADDLAKQFKEVFSVRTLMMFLSSHGINPIQSVAVFKRWGGEAINLIKANPYILSNELNISFYIADNIAMTLSFGDENPDRVLGALIFILSHNANNGHTCVPKDKLLQKAFEVLKIDIDIITNCLQEFIDGRELYEKFGLIYLESFYNAQRYIASRLTLMLRVPPDKIDTKAAIELIEQHNGIKYETLQKKAIRDALNNDIFILTGGPGTGKTTTLNGIIEVLEMHKRTVCIAAPTGRAAKRMSDVTKREAKTIHRLLGVEFRQNEHTFVHNEQNPLEFDAIIIDEMSMVDTILFDALLRGIKGNSKLILVGDFHQLPSVGAGNILRDLLESDIIPTVELSHIFRQAAKSLIVTNAHNIVKGIMPNLNVRDNDFFFLPVNNEGTLIKTIVDLYANRLPKAYDLSAFEQIQVLSPQRKGSVGVIELNHHLQEALNPKSAQKAELKGKIYTFRIGDKVMQVKNNYDITWVKGNDSGIGIFNGDIGIIKMIDRGSKTVAIEFEERIAYYDFDMTVELELAYAVTVHKSQGNEFEAIILPIYEVFNKLCFRNLLYTAVTRAKRILVIVGSKKCLQRMVENNRKCFRFTGLKELLLDDNENF